jgi:hypothetical protein
MMSCELPSLLAWMLVSSLSKIVAGWGFQLNADVTGNFCRANVDLVALVGLCVISAPCQNKARDYIKLHGMTYAQQPSLSASSSRAGPLLGWELCNLLEDLGVVV